MINVKKKSIGLIFLLLVVTIIIFFNIFTKLFSFENVEIKKSKLFVSIDIVHLLQNEESFKNKSSDDSDEDSFVEEDSFSDDSENESTEDYYQEN